MDVRLPYSSRKRYLTGIDWAVNGLNRMTLRRTGVGNQSQVLLTLRGTLDPNRLAAAMQRLQDRLPILNGRVARDWNLAPYWSSPATRTDTTDGEALRVVNTPGPDTEATPPPELLQGVNQPFANPHRHLRVTLAHAGSSHSCLALVFDHRLLDAVGAEAFLELLDRADRGEAGQALEQVRLTEPAHLCRWADRFRAGHRINRLFQKLSREQVRALPVPERGSGDFRFEIICFTPEETAGILEQAFARTGHPILLPYALAGALQSLHPLMERSGTPAENYVVPVSLGERTPAEKWEKLLFNWMSFVYFVLPAETMASGSRLEEMLRDQLYEHIGNGVPADFRNAAMLARIVPERLMPYLARFPLGGRMGSLYFACLRQPTVPDPQFMDLPVVNVFHTPRLPVPPGVGILLNQFQDRMNAVVSYLEGTMTPGDARAVGERLRKALVARGNA